MRVQSNGIAKATCEGDSPAMKLRRGAGLGSIVIWVALPLWAGGWIYLLFRSKRLWMFHWIGWLGCLDALDRLRSLAHPIRAGLPEWVLFSVPTALYTLSFLNCCWLLLHGERKLATRISILVAIGTLACELLQLAWPRWGTFSIEDLAFDCLAIACSLPFFHAVVRRRESGVTIVD